MQNKLLKISLISLVLLVGFILVVDKVLSFQGSRVYSGIKRFIRLKENTLLSTHYYVPSKEDLEIVDNLEVRKYTIRIDADGYVMPSKIHEVPEVVIVFLGGSTTACYCMEEENRFPYLAGRNLEKQTGRKVNSYNSGVGGNDSLHSIDILVNKILPLKPDIAVMMHNINDLSLLLFENSYWSNNPSRSPIAELRTGIRLKELIPALIPNTYTETKKIEKNIRYWRDTFLGRTIKRKESEVPDEFEHARGKQIVIDQEALLREFDLNLQTFVNICSAGEITPVLMTMANRLKEPADPLIRQTVGKLKTEHGITYTDYKTIFDLFNQRIRWVAARNHIPLIDLADHIPPEKEFMYDIVHLTDRGSQAAATLIAPTLNQLVSQAPLRHGQSPAAH
jgi:lysophospholipase L1-like esterase